MKTLKAFIKAKSEDQNLTSIYNTRKNCEESSGSGNESGVAIKNVYESIIGSDRNNDKHSDTVKQPRELKPDKRTQNIDRSIPKQFNINFVMKAIEINNVAEVRSIMQGNEKNINFTDQFGWSPLMCACCAGAVDIVQYLLQLNPDIILQDKKGNTCFSIAKSKGHYEIIAMLKNYSQMSKSSSLSNSNTYNTKKLKAPCTEKELFCDTCHKSFKNNDWNKHVTSTVHLFNTASKSEMPTMYGIPESNKGYQMLLRHGWDREKGLGPEGSGHKFPLKTILKQDRLGLGAKNYTTRVTHPTTEIIEKSKVKCRLKHDLKTLRHKEKVKERAIRRMLD